jgi:ribosomal protein L24
MATSAPLNVTSSVDASALIPTGTLVHVTAGPHRGKKGRVRSASGDGHVLIDAHGHSNPIRVNKHHVMPADTVSQHMDTAIRTMFGKNRKR